MSGGQTNPDAWSGKEGPAKYRSYERRATPKLMAIARTYFHRDTAAAEDFAQGWFTWEVDSRAGRPLYEGWNAERGPF